MVEASAQAGGGSQDDPLGTVLDQLRQVVDCAAASILLLERDELKHVAHRGSNSGEEASLLPFVDRNNELWAAMQSGKPVIVDDVRGEGRLAHPEDADQARSGLFPFTAETVERLTTERPFQAAGAALLRHAWTHRATLLS
mgnify:CR=1 FL=1